MSYTTSFSDLPGQRTIDQRAVVSRQSGEEPLALFYELSTCFSVIQSAVYMLKQKKINQIDRDQYVDALSRSLASAESMLRELTNVLGGEVVDETSPARPAAIDDLFRDLHNQLPTAAPKEFEAQIGQLTRMTDALAHTSPRELS